MPDPLIEFSQTILKLNKGKKFSDALKHFKENKSAFTPEEIRGNSFLIAAMITALRRTNNIDQAFKFIEIYDIIFNTDTKENILCSYGWLLYDKYKSENHLIGNPEIETEFYDDEFIEGNNVKYIDKTDTVKLIEDFIPLILIYNSTYAYNVFSKLFNIIPKIEKKKANANWKLVNDYCNLVPVDRLKVECETREVERKGKMIQMEFASDKENWYAYKSKALMKLGNFQDCYTISNSALEIFEKFHYSNDIWFARRIALSKKHLGNSESAISELQEIIKRKQEWFIEKELAQLFKENGDLESAFKFAIRAINNFGDIEYKVDLLFLLGELLKERKQEELAFKHFYLSRLIRISEEWSIPSKLTSAINQFKKEEIPLEKLYELKDDLRKYWNSFKYQQNDKRPPNHAVNQRMSGKIEKILHNDERGADGFINYGGKKSVYFRINPGDKIKSRLTIGLAVEFKILPAREDKKEKAVQVRVCE